MSKKKHIYIIGSKGIPARYGGFETFVDKITGLNKDSQLKYHIACLKGNSIEKKHQKKEFFYNNAHCFNIAVPEIGPAKAIIYDLKALNYALCHAKKNNIDSPVFYVLACRIGPFISVFKKRIDKLNGKLVVNPDGHEWKRKKWSTSVRKYWKFSEKLMVKYSDLLVCDSKNIEKYILKEYSSFSPKTCYIAYGTDVETSKLKKNDDQVREWFSKKQIQEGQYYLVVGRFVPENNYEEIIKSFMKSTSSKDLVLITNVEKNSFYNELANSTDFLRDTRIKFVGTVYEKELLKYIRENAFSYIHGHEVGGTNPSLLEAMGSTSLNLLLNVGFNKEVGRDSALYWSKDGSFYKLLNQLEDDDTYYDYTSKLKSNAHILDEFSWETIVSEYISLWNKLMG